MPLTANSRRVRLHRISFADGCSLRWAITTQTTPMPWPVWERGGRRIWNLTESVRCLSSSSKTKSVMKSKVKRRMKRAAIGLTIICALIGALLVIVPYATTGTSWDSSRGSNSSSIGPALRGMNNADSVLTVMTANIAHGRGTRRHQALLNRDTIRSNLDEIAKVFLRVQTDVVALQEADNPSLWRSCSF